MRSDVRRALRAWDNEPRRRLACRIRTTLPTLEDARLAFALHASPDAAGRCASAIDQLAASRMTTADQFVASAVLIEPLLRAATPETFGVNTVKSAANKIGLIRKAVSLVDPATVAGREADLASLPGNWLSQLERLEDALAGHAASSRAILRRLALTADRLGLTPATLDADVVAEFVDREVSTHAQGYIEKLRAAFRAWNLTADETGAALLEVPATRSVRQRSVDWSSLPDAIRQPVDDVLGRAVSVRVPADWSCLVGGDDPDDFDLGMSGILSGVGDVPEPGEGARVLEPGTRKNWRDCVKRAYQAAIDDPKVSKKPRTLEDLFDPDVAKAVIRGVRGARRDDREARGESFDPAMKGRYEHGLLEALSAVGHATGVASDRLASIETIKRNIDPAIIGWKRSAEGGMRAVYADRRIGKRHADMLRQFNEDSALRRWFEAPRVLWLQARPKGATATLTDAARARSALIAQIGQRVAPLRRLNYVRLRHKGPDPHIRLPVGEGHGWLVIPAIETKTMAEIRVRIDPETVRMIREYIRVFLPVARKKAGATEDNPHLFPGSDGGAPRTGRIRPRTGIPVDRQAEHDFREAHVEILRPAHVPARHAAHLRQDHPGSGSVRDGPRAGAARPSLYQNDAELLRRGLLDRHAEPLPASSRAGHAQGPSGLEIHVRRNGEKGEEMMAKHRVALPPADWPEDIRQRLEATLEGVSAHQRRRLTGAMGRWIKSARDERVPPGLVTMDLWRARTRTLKQTGRDAVRQAVVAVFPEARSELFRGGGVKKPVLSARGKLAALIARNLARWPADWRTLAEARLTIDPEGFDDGLLIQAWTPATIKGRLEYMSAHFDFCRENGLAPDVTPATVRANLRHRQQRCAAGEMRIGGTAVYLSQISGLACALRPELDWNWLLLARNRFKKLANAHPSRNDGRVIEIVELRTEALAEMRRADRALAKAKTQRQRIAAHTRARTALAMLLLSEAPIRVGSLAGVGIGRQLSPDLRTISLSPQETKEGKSDQRRLSDTAVTALSGYIGRYRSCVAPAAESALFVADDGAPVSADHLSRRIGDFCEKKFGRRTTAHPIRNSVGAFIVAEAPEESGLASLVLNHSDAETTNAYTGTAGQVIAGRRLRDATVATASAVGATAKGRDRPVKGRRPRSFRAELAERAAGRRERQGR